MLIKVARTKRADKEPVEEDPAAVTGIKWQEDGEALLKAMEEK